MGRQRERAHLAIAVAGERAADRNRVGHAGRGLEYADITDAGLVAEAKEVVGRRGKASQLLFDCEISIRIRDNVDGQKAIGEREVDCDF